MNQPSPVDLAMCPSFDSLHLFLTLTTLAFIAVAVILFLRLKKITAETEMPSLKSDTLSKEDIQAQAPSEPEKPTPASLVKAKPDSAIQLLGLMQQEARFIDFIKEDVTQYSDAEIGAASRIVHDGCRRIIEQNFTITPVHEQDEQSHVTIPEGFDNSRIRLTGNVSGQAPFSGTLVHRGWEVTEVHLPSLAEGHEVKVLVPAEVEL